MLINVKYEICMHKFPTKNLYAQKVYYAPKKQFSQNLPGIVQFLENTSDRFAKSRPENSDNF